MDKYLRELEREARRVGSWDHFRIAYNRAHGDGAFDRDFQHMWLTPEYLRSLAIRVSDPETCYEDDRVLYIKILRGEFGDSYAEELQHIQWVLEGALCSRCLTDNDFDAMGGEGPYLCGACSLEEYLD